MYMTTDLNNVVAEDNNDAGQWHNRFGHMSQKGIRELLSKGKLSGLKIVNFDMCESCIMWKQKKLSFLIGGRKLRAFNLWGPSPVASLGGSRYYITFIDNCNIKVLIYFLKNKFEIFNTFKIWKAKVEIEIGLKLKCLRFDNGGEYIDGGFKEYCATNGIMMEKTIPRTPYQNGVAEWMNITINECGRSMRLHFGLPKMF